MTRSVLSICCALATASVAFAQNSTPNSAQTSPASPSAHDLARTLNRAFADVYEKVSPGVVVIEARAVPATRRLQQNSPLWQFFQQDPDGSMPQAPQSGEVNQGSGFLISSDGYILTNNHVLEGATANGLSVILTSGRKFPAKVVGVDPASDLAVLKIKASNLPVVELGDSDRTRVGEFAFAIGAPYDLRNTFTYGIVSAKGRTNLTSNPDYEEYIQTDASINPGNSGGPLVDIDGRVIGVNTLIYGLDRGLGFAIPINIAKKIATQLITQGRASRPWLGIMIGSLDHYPQLTAANPNLQGILVERIVPGTPASLSGLRPADVITSVDGVTVANPHDLQKVIFNKNVGDEVELQVWRANRLVKVKLRTAERVDRIQQVVNQQPFPQYQPPAGDDATDDADADEQDAPPAPVPQAQTPAPMPPSPTAGLELCALNPDHAVAMKLSATEGLLVTSVQPGSRADAAGVQIGDVITSVGDTKVRTKEDFVKALREAQSDGVLLNIQRGDEKTFEILKR
jgi:Do/DeqQ family serine protease